MSVNYKIDLLYRDPKQTGPKVFSPEAKALGLGKSFLKRLFKEYQEQAKNSIGMPGFDKNTARQVIDENSGIVNTPFVCTLVKNYRSHPKIVQFLADIFYGGTDKMQPCAQISVDAQNLKPITFYVTVGKEEMEKESFSWNNSAEIERITEIVTSILEEWKEPDWGPRRPEEICVVSYFDSQVHKIRLQLKNMKFQQVQVFPISSIQGSQN